MGDDALLRLDDVVILLLDHQSGLFQVKDFPVAEFRGNTAMLAKLGSLLKISVITTASVPDGPTDT